MLMQFQWRIHYFPDGGTPTPAFGSKTYYYHPQTKLQKGNVFTSVCQEFCPLGDVHPTGQTTPRQTLPVQTHPQADTPLVRHPPGRHPQADGYCSGRYASYWNAFFLGKIFAKNCMKMKEIGPGRARP